ncbi:MAG: hypothetical protein ACREOZ_04855 [Gloeomargaritales cyanobacterium]
MAPSQLDIHDQITSRTTRQPDDRATRQPAPHNRTTSRPTRQPDDRATRQPAPHNRTTSRPTRQPDDRTTRQPAPHNRTTSRSTRQTDDDRQTLPTTNSFTATGHLFCRIDLMREVKRILASPLHPVVRPFFRFSMTERASTHNHRILKASNFDLHQAIMAQPNSPVTYGSEFRPWRLLQPLLRSHPLWHRVKSILEKGISMPLKPLIEADRQADIEYMINRGNHKSTLRNTDIMRKLMEEDVTHGHSLPIPTTTIQFLKHVSVAPLGLAEQSTINESGVIVPKHRMTHDQSLAGPSDLSVNSRTIVEELQPCMFGHAIRRILHYIADCRRRHPTARILMGKFDIKAAYRRAHFQGVSATESITIFENAAFIALRQTFGAMSGPNNWCCISEMMCDLANDIIQTGEGGWDYRSVKSPHLDVIPTPCRLEDHLPFAQAADFHVDIPQNDKGLVDCYIDDLVPICVDLKDRAERCAAAVALALHIMGRPVQAHEPIPRDDILSLKKLLGEGRMEEIKVILGWEVNSRALTIALPIEKYSSWRQNIVDLCTSRNCSFKELDTLVGRLNHIGFIIPQARHFLNRN